MTKLPGNMIPDEEILEERITAREFQSKGLLMEVNRRFLHPLGYALGITTAYDDDPGLLFIAHTYDPEGYVFDSFKPEDIERARKIEEDLARACMVRFSNNIGERGVQPIIVEEEGFTQP